MIFFDFFFIVECHSHTSPSLSPYSDCSSPRPRHRETSPPFTPYSDISSSTSDCDSEPDQAPIPSKPVPMQILGLLTDLSIIYLLYLVKLTNASQFVRYCIVN